MFDILNSKGVDLKKSDLIKSRIQVALQNSINDPARAELEVSRVADLWRDLNDFKERGLKTDEVFHSVHHYYSVLLFKADSKIFQLSRFDAVKQSDDEKAVIQSFHDLILHCHTCLDLQKYVNAEACSKQTIIEPLLNQVDNGNYILRLLQITLQSPTVNRQPVYTYFIHLQHQLLAQHPELDLTSSQPNNQLVLSAEEVTKYRMQIVRFLLKYLRELYVTQFNESRAKYYSRAIVEPSVDPKFKDESFDTNITTRMAQIEEGNPRATSWPIFPSHPDYRSTDDADPVKFTAKYFDQKADLTTQSWLLVELAEEIIADPEFYSVVGFGTSKKRQGQDRHLFSTNPAIEYPLVPFKKFNKGESTKLAKRPWMSVIFDAGQYSDSFWTQVAKGKYDAAAASQVETRYKSTQHMLNWLHRAYADGQLKDNWVDRLYADRLTYLLEYLGVFLAFAQQEWLDTSLPGENFQKLTMFYGENHDDTALNYHESFKAEDHLDSSLKTVELNAYQAKK